MELNPSRLRRCKGLSPLREMISAIARTSLGSPLVPRNVTNMAIWCHSRRSTVASFSTGLSQPFPVVSRTGHQWARISPLRSRFRIHSSSSSSSPSSSPFDPRHSRLTSAKKPSPAQKGKKHPFIPRKAAVTLTEQARKVFQALLHNPPRPEIIGIALNYEQSHTGEPRMVFSFSFVTSDDLGPNDEPVSLEVVEVVATTRSDGDGSTPTTTWVPKPPKDSWNDGLPKLYVRANAFLKVLGATVDVDAETITPILFDKEGNRMDPNA